MADVTEEKVMEYVACVRGCQTRMLSGMPCGVAAEEAPPTPPSDADVATAVRRIQDKFVYVGVTEKFRESVLDWYALVRREGEP